MFFAKCHSPVWRLAVLCVGFATLGCQPSELVTITNKDPAKESTVDQSSSASAELRQPIPELLADVPFFQAKMWIADDALPWDAWYVQYLRGQRIGYFHLNVSRGTSLLRVRRSKLVELVGGEEQELVQFDVELDSYEYADGRIASFEERTTGGESSRSVAGEFKGKEEVSITIAEGDRRERKKLPWEEGTWGVLGIQSVLLCEPMSAGETRRAKIFLTTNQEIEAVKFMAGELELTSLPGGVTRELLPVEVSGEEGNDFANLKVWVDSQGKIKKSVTLEGTKISTFEVPAEAGRVVADEYRLKSLLGTAVPFAGQLPDAGTSTVTYSVQSSSLSMYDLWASNVRQSVKSNSALNFEITIHNVADLEAMAPFDKATPTEEYLASTPLIQSDDPVIETLALGLVESTDSLATVVAKLTRGVQAQLEETDFSEQVLSGVDAARQLRGDCTEHAMLLVTLLRNRGIPARVAGGLQLVPEKRNFTFHMWTEAWIGDRWLPIDGTTGEIASLRCIKMFDSSMAIPNPYTVILPIFEKMPSLRLSCELAKWHSLCDHWSWFLKRSGASRPVI